MMRMDPGFVLAWMLAGCAARNAKPLFSEVPTYPCTSVLLSHGKSLKHLAGRPCETTARPEIGVSDGERTFSEWHLHADNRSLLAKAPSFLSDPAFAGEFEDAYRRDDFVKVFESESGNTILVVEDRSPTFPRRAYLLLRADVEGRWSFRDLALQPYRPTEKASHANQDASGPLDLVFPEILQVTDSHIRYSSAAGSIRASIDSLPYKSGI